MKESKFVKANEKIADGAVGAYKAVEGAVVGGYKAVEGAVVGAYTKVEDAFVGRFLTHEGETVDEAKARLRGESEPVESDEPVEVESCELLEGERE